jgi:hypothetical protein
MPRIAAIIALGLMLLTGIAIGQVPNLGISSMQPAAVPSTDSSLTVDRFYAAINHLLLTGEVANLRTVAAPDYVEHHNVDAPGDIDSLEGSLLALRARFPDVQLEAIPITGERELIAVQVRVRGMNDPILAGLSVDVASPVESYELLRIQGDRVTERWTTFTMPGSYETVASVEQLELTARLRQPVVERLTLEPQALLEDHMHHGAVIIAESGTLRVQLAGSTDLPERLEPGVAKVVEPEASFELWNAGREPATAFLLSVRVLDSIPAYAHTSGDAEERGISRELLAGGAGLRPLEGPFEMRVGHAIAVPGTTVPAHLVDEAEMMLVTEGTLQAHVVSGEVWTVSHSGDFQSKDGSHAIGPDQAISAGFGTELSYEVTGNDPAEFWLITITPITEG